MEFLIMFVGLTFFLFTMWTIDREYRREQDRTERKENLAYERKLNEAREFGFGGKHQHTAKTLKEK